MRTSYYDVDTQMTELSKLAENHPHEYREFRAKLECSLIHHENALEGVVFSSSEILGALSHSVVADVSLTSIYAEIRRHKAAIDYIHDEARHRKQHITITTIKKIHELLTPSHEEKEGKPLYRKDIPVHRTYFHEIAHPSKILPSLEELTALTNTAEYRESHPINQAAIVHWYFMQAFPFSVNNGRTGRLLSNLILFRHGFLPAVILSVDRQRYYESLKLPIANLRQLILEAIKNSLENAFRFFENKAPVYFPCASNE